MGTKNLITTKKFKLAVIGDKEETNRVYQYIRNGMYASYQAKNRLMGQIASIYYDCDRDFKSEEFKMRTKEAYRSNNPIFDDIEFPTGADLKSNIIRKVQQDFSTALKNGLANGDRTIPFYKRSSPMPARGSFLRFSVQTDEETGKEYYMIKWSNKIQFRVILNGYGKSKSYSYSLLNRICKPDSDVKVCTSQIVVDGHDIFLFLTVQMPAKEEGDLDDKMIAGVSIGLNNPCEIAYSDGTSVSIDLQEDLLYHRKQFQKKRERLQKACKDAAGGRGRKHKLQALDRVKMTETHYAQTYNHKLSKKIVDEVLKKKASVIVLEDLSHFKEKEENKELLRNWKYYQLYDFISYKAKRHGIKTVISKMKHPDCTCHVCGFENEKLQLAEMDIRNHQYIFSCTNCGESISYDSNRAKNLCENK